MAYVGAANVLVHDDEGVYFSDFLWLRPVRVQFVEFFEERLQLVASESVRDSEPVHRWLVVDLEVVFRDDAEVVTCAAHTPVEVRMRGCGDVDQRAIGNDDAHVNDIVEHEAEIAHVFTETTAKSGAHHTDATTCSRSYDVSVKEAQRTELENLCNWETY